MGYVNTKAIVALLAPLGATFDKGMVVKVKTRKATL